MTYLNTYFELGIPKNNIKCRNCSLFNIYKLRDIAKHLAKHYVNKEIINTIENNIILTIILTII